MKVKQQVPLFNLNNLNKQIWATSWKSNNKHLYSDCKPLWGEPLQQIHFLFHLEQQRS